MAINGGLAVSPELAVNVERYAVYRCYGDDGQLLYVGETGELGTRFASHAQKLWFTQVRGITLEWYIDELDALNAERRAIHVEHPKYNVVHRHAATPAPQVPRPQRRQRPAQTASARGDGLGAGARTPLAGRGPGAKAAPHGRRAGAEAWHFRGNRAQADRQARNRGRLADRSPKIVYVPSVKII
jgi:hypothetical protein